MVNKLIVLPLQINGSDTLYFILDTGLQKSIISGPEQDEALELRQAREVQLRGIPSVEPVHAILSTGNHTKIGNITLHDQDFIILPGNLLKLSAKMGMKIHGLLNLESLQQYILEIDYDSKLLTFYEPGTLREYKNLEGFTSLPMDINHNVPAVRASIVINHDTTLPVRLMLDTGAGNSLNLYTGTLPDFDIPEGSRDSFLGSSLKGNIEGKVGRIQGIRFGPHQLSDVIVSYPDPPDTVPGDGPSGRNGSLGAEFLRRFNAILDFSDRKIHITPGNAYNEAFFYDMSGLEIQTTVPVEQRFIVTGIRKRSRAEMAGVRTGDEILSINGIPSEELNLDEVYRNLAGQDGKRIRLELLREGKRIRAVFRLEKYI